MTRGKNLLALAGLVVLAAGGAAVANAGVGDVIESNYAEVANSNGHPFSALFVSSETPILNALSSEARARWQSDVAAAKSAFASGDHRQMAITLKPMLQFLSSEPKVSRTWLDVAFADGHQVRIEQMIELKPSQHPSEGIVAWKMQDLSSGKTIAYATWDPASASHYSADGEALASSVLASASAVVAMPHAVSGGECQKVLLQGPARASFGCLTNEHFNDSPASLVSSMLNSLPPDAAERLNLALSLVQGVSAESVKFATGDGVLPLVDPLVPVFTIPGTPVGDHLTITRVEGEDELPTLDAPSSAIGSLFPGKPGWTPIDPNATTTDRLNTFFAIGN